MSGGGLILWQMGKVTEVAKVAEVTRCFEGVREAEATEITGCDMDFCAVGMVCGGILNFG
jgi:hypothetical protein